MKAQFVNENINFKRGKGPVDSMKLGLKQKIYDKLLELKNFRGVLGMELYHLRPKGNLKLRVRYVGEKYKPVLGPEGNYWENVVNKIIGEYAEFEMGNPDSDLFHFPIFPEYQKIFREIFNEDSVTESVNFERGEDPKTSMGIGKIANATKILYVEEEQWEGGRVSSKEDLEQSGGNTWDNTIDDEDFIHHLLANWEEEIDSYYSFWVKHELKPVKGLDEIEAEYRHPSELEGDFVEYKGETYKIPETGLFKDAAQLPA